MQLTIEYEFFKSAGELPASDAELVRKARKAAEGAYAPYSKFHVGAAVRTSGGHIVTGSNQENAAYPSGLCAERVAVFAAGAGFPDEDVVSLAIFGGGDPVEEGGVVGPDTSGPVAPEASVLPLPAITPCGACREVIAECSRRSGKPVSIILAGPSPAGIFKFDSIEALLPFGFSLRK